MGLKIAVWHDPPSGGAQRSLSEMLSRLVQRGHTVDIFRLGTANQDATSESAYGLRTEVIPFQRRRHIRKAFYWNDILTWCDWCDEERLEQQLAARLDAGGYDVVFASVLRWGTAPDLLRYCHTPTIYYCHEPPRRFYEAWCRPEAAPMTSLERARLLWRWPAQQLLDRRDRGHDHANVVHATTVLTNSRYTQRRIREVYGRESEVCYLGVDSAAFTAREHPDASSVVTVGALETHKGFDFLIEALGLVPASQRPALTIVGSHGHRNMPAHLDRLAAAAHVKLQLRRGLSDNDLAELYRSSAAFLFGARMEPFGLVLLEAMASGLPVVAVAEGGVPEIVEDGVTGFLTQRDPAEFAARLTAVLADNSLRTRMGSAARASAEHNWTWDRTVDNLEAYLTKTAARQSSRLEMPA